MAKNSLLPKGYKALGDKTLFNGKIKNLSPVQEELRSLMVPDKDLKSKKDIEAKARPPISKLRSLSDTISNNIQSQTDLRVITPYIKRAEQIWLTLLLKPNGLNQDMLTYETVDTNLKNSKLHSLLLERLKSHINTVYPIQDKLPQIIKDVMFRTGSYVILNLSHSALDHVINGMAVEGSESLRKDIFNLRDTIIAREFENGSTGRCMNLGWIRKNKPKGDQFGFESIFKNKEREAEFDLVDKGLGWSFTDNTIALKVGELKQKLATNKLLDKSGVESLDSIVANVFGKDKGSKKPNDNNLKIANKDDLFESLKQLYPNRNWGENESLSIRHKQYYSGNGKGLGVTYHVPSEAVIPVHQNGEKDSPIGYIFLTDQTTGDFLRTTQDIKYYSSMKHRKESGTSAPKKGTMNDIISNLRNVADGKPCEIDMDWAIDYTTGLLEKEMMESFFNGDKHVPVTISLTEANKKLYFSRAIKQQGVRSIFVPAEYVTYFALDYNDLGVGKSLVEEAKKDITRIALLDIADLIANMENSLSKTLLTVDLEEENFNPQEVLNQIREDYLNGNPSLINFVGFASMPIDRIIDGVKESLVRIKVNANNNPYVINPNVEESQDQREGIKPVDSDSIQRALTSLANRFELKRSWLEDSEDGNNFAIEALADQEMLKNSTIEKSIAFSLMISEQIGKYTYINEPLLAELITIIKENKTLYEKPDVGGKLLEGYDDITEQRKVIAVLEDFLNNLDIKLPLPASVESYNKLTDKIDAASKLVDGWKTIGFADKLLERVLKESNLENGEKDDTHAEYINSIVESVLVKEAYRTLGIKIPFDEVITNGKSGGMMTFINDITGMRNNTITFIEELFKEYRKSDSRINALANKYKDGLIVLKEETETVITETNDDSGIGNDDESNNNEEVIEENNITIDETEEEMEDNTEGEENNADDAEKDLNEGLDLGGNIKF